MSQKPNNFEPLTPQEIDSLRTDVMNIIINDIGHTNPNLKTFCKFPLIGSVIRLIFHDCAGPQSTNNSTDPDIIHPRICDGCLDVNRDDHAGLRPLAIAPLEDLFKSKPNNWNQRISRSDFWAAVGTQTMYI